MLHPAVDGPGMRQKGLLPLNEDRQYMQQVLDLARQGTALASPNPRVGALLVRDGRIVGRGVHRYGERLHAEACALAEAGDAAWGATLYINLEPCSHTGRTPPCCDAVIRAGVRRVVAAMQDPNPAVAGEGFRRLRAAGVEVETGLLEEEARDLNESFCRWIRARVPFVTLKSAMTLDGRIAAPPSRQFDRARSQEWITSEEARWNVQQVRHEHDAIMVGVGTVLADNPLLTDRTGLPRRRPLLRVVLDSTLRLPLDCRLVQTVRDGDLLVFCSFAETHKVRDLERAGVRVIQVDGAQGRTDPAAVLKRLGALEITSLLVEGGAQLNWALLSRNLVDKVLFYYAPCILGGEESVPLAAGTGYDRVSEAARLQRLTLQRFGADFAVQGYLRDVYAEDAVATRSDSVSTPTK